MKNAVEIIQGPPGTGKSTIISSIIRNDLDYKTSRKKVIVTFLKNKAMESIIEKLTNHKILVFGAHNKLPPLCLQHEIYRKIDTNEQINKLRKEFKLFREKILVKISNLEEKMNEEETEPLKKEIKSTKKSLSDRKANLERRVQMEIRREIESADVILSTISSLAKIINAANKSSANLKVHTAILDEAGCVEEISTFAIFNLLPDNVILIGDHLQLRPLYFNQEQNYAMTSKKSLMERAIEAGCKHSTLDIQYRMHKDIMTLVSNLFYGGKLKMGDIVRERKNGVLWKDVNSIEKVEKDGMYFNDGEIEECVRIYERERNFDSTQTIMIIVFG
ncbi:hypothetical protein MHBO_003952 [Bonamia ostreae]|uniref:DNA2/NAM7 helicase helicase domain-containing protein n=1 Tax=Bonamia ostreae TaxID=126728 RepID=A0ABV2AS00_9EUKA